MKKMILRYAGLREWQRKFCAWLKLKYITKGTNHRQSVIAGGLALLISPDPDAERLQEPDGRLLVDWLREEYRKLRTESAGLYAQYQRAPDFEKEKMRQRILEQAIPGWSYVEEIWSGQSHQPAMRYKILEPSAN